MDRRAETMVWASLAADSLALGVHWIYDTDVLKKDFGQVDALLKPRPDSFHPTKNKGEFTHYGDQTMVLLESMAAHPQFDLEDFSTRWRNLFSDYQGYLDKATKMTIEGYAQGKGPEEAGSFSDDFSAVSRLGPVVFFLKEDHDRLIKAAVEQARMTHNSSDVLEAAEFFAGVLNRILKGASPRKAIEDTPVGFRSAEWVRQGLESVGSDSVEVIRGFGQNCRTQSAFPGIVHLAVKYENDLKKALNAAMTAGGDNAARGMMIGLLLGAHLGPEALPAEWREGLKAGPRIKSLLAGH